MVFLGGVNRLKLDTKYSQLESSRLRSCFANQKLAGAFCFSPPHCQFSTLCSSSRVGKWSCSQLICSSQNTHQPVKKKTSPPPQKNLAFSTLFFNVVSLNFKQGRAENIPSFNALVAWILFIYSSHPLVLV